MREILFRGKLTTDGGWTEGNLAVRKNGMCIITPDATPLGRYGGVYPETVGQYTGRNDKNGKKIYEGDVIKCTTPNADIPWWIYHESIYVVKYSNDYVGFTPLCEYDCEYGGAVDPKDFEVIGNIHDNPELLKEAIIND